MVMEEMVVHMEVEEGQQKMDIGMIHIDTVIVVNMEEVIGILVHGLM